MRAVVAAALALCPLACSPNAAPVPAAGMAADVAFLASPALEGRAAGSPGADSAAVFIARQYEGLGLRPVFRVSCDAPPCALTWFQTFRITDALAQNVAAAVDGSDSLLRNEFIVLGAHYDHIGRMSQLSHDRERGTVVRPGADDNASGTAAVLELARRFSERPARRSILFLNFDAEERGLIGSRVFVEHAPVPMQAIPFMLNLDMVGRLRADRILVENAERPSTRASIDSLARLAGIAPHFVPNEGRSDHSSFAAVKIDAVHMSTGYHIDYHTSGDVSAKVDVAGLERVVNVAESILRRMADRER